MSRRFTTSELRAELKRSCGVDVSLRRLAQWATSGLLIPTDDWAGKRGAKRYYSEADLLKAQTILKMRQSGLSIQKARVALAWQAGYDSREAMP